MDIILASTSPYRKALLERLQIPFSCAPPDTEESPLEHEPPGARCIRLALEKARAVSAQFPEAVVIGSDQVASLEGHVLHKPGDHASATLQLRASAGKELEFSTGLAVLAPSMNLELTHMELFKVHFRMLDDAEIERYLRADQPYDCAGSFKAESLGISLFERMEGRDPSSLIGLPLIALSALLRKVGIGIP